MKYFSMFSGIGGFELGIKQAYELSQVGVKSKNSTNIKGRTPQHAERPLCIGYSEIDKYAIQVYKKHFNHINYGDATKIIPEQLPDFDLLVGGFPCQAFSVAGKRQGFDEIRITTVPRYKTSELSGSEWRISAEVQLLRKGKVIVEERYGNVESAAKFLPYLISSSLDDGRGFFAGIEDLCDQEGCSNRATISYTINQEYCVGGGNCGQKIESVIGKKYRMFCDEHKVRGDSDLEDNDKNYTEEVK